MIPEVGIFDYILGLAYFILIYFFAYAYKSKKEETDNTYQYFMYALSTKVFGGLGFLFLSVYYWGGGDSFSYFNTAHDYAIFFLEDSSQALDTLFLSSKDMNWYKYEWAFNRHHFLNSPATYTVVKITSIINLISFNSYLPSTLIYSTLSFLGVWNMYFVFCKLYPHLKKRLLYGFFFIPSVVLWGSGILKDTITIAAIGWLMYAFINLVLLKRKKTKSLILIVIATLSIALLKPYILYVLYPALFLWVQGNLKSLISSNLLRKLFAPFIAVILIMSSYFLSQKLSENAGKYSINKLENTLEGFQSWHTTVSEKKHQSGYTLGDTDFSPLGILKKIPSAIGVTFFRPYIWEVNNASTLLGALEGLVITILTIWLLLKYRLRLFRLIYRNKDVLFLLLFSLIFGVVVGISSYNFGALSRYKMPAQMFFVVGMILILDKTNKGGIEN
ncbi:MAG: hypothetical protein HRT73_00165 [Flavobacteriales bacterium]|nr:hypothetical protein [Flavobacteriales bacterium]NQX96285.1 hypothetical protein [Flavobacteriales bacterium]